MMNFSAMLRNGRARVVALALGMVVTSVAGSAAADVTIAGVRDGQTVTKPIRLTATSDADRLFGLNLQIIGPGGYNRSNSTDRSSVSLVSSADQPWEEGLWNPADAPEGRYTVTAYAAERRRNGTAITSESVTFRVKHVTPAEAASTPETVEGSAADSGANSADKDAAAKAIERNTLARTGRPADLEVTPVSITPESSAEETPAVTAEASTARASDVSIRFANGTAKTRTIGSTSSIDLIVAGDLPTEGDVLVIAWDHDRARVVDGFVQVFEKGPFRIDAGMLNQLKAGSVELQAHVREDGKIIKTVKHTLDILPRPEPTAGDLPNIKFDAGTPGSWTYGSLGGVGIDVAGPLPFGGDLLMLAWSLDEKRVVDDFTHTLTTAPFSITAAQMGKLPAGRVELQIRPRIDGKILDKISKTIIVKVASGGNGNDGTTDPEPVDEPTTGNPDDTDSSGGDGETPAPGIETPGDGGSAVGNGSNVKVRFAPGTASTYRKGSNAAINLEVEGNLPDGGDVLLILWHNGQDQLISGFAHELKAAPWQVSNSKLDSVPTGQTELQALLRIPGQPIRIQRFSLTVLNADGSGAEEVVDNNDNAGNKPDYSGVPLTSAGFTAFTKSGDTRIVYVSSSSGDDANDGLSPAKPVKSLSAGYSKLRSGFPDWMLLKAGDSFYGNLPNLGKSGRSVREKMLIGVYGNGDRPKLYSPEGSLIRSEFSTDTNHVAIVGLHGIARFRDTSSSSFSASKLTPDVWAASGVKFLGNDRDILVEDCIFEYFKFGMVFQSSNQDGFMRDVTVRRTAVLNSYGHWDKKVAGHSSGMYAAKTDNMLIEDCVFANNGFSSRVSGAGRTKFNHNLYSQDNSQNTTLRNNIISNGASHGLQLRGGGTVENNLFVKNPIGFFVAQGESKVTSNVILQGTDMGKEQRGLGMEVLPCVNAVLTNNIFAQKQGTADFTPAISIVWERETIEWLAGRPYKVTLKDNKIYRWPRYDGRQSAINFGTPSAKIIENSRNAIDKASGGNSNPPWVDPDRDVESYMKSLGKPASLDAFVNAAAYRPRGQWAAEYSADGVNSYIRRGFDVSSFD